MKYKLNLNRETKGAVRYDNPIGGDGDNQAVTSIYLRKEQFAKDLDLSGYPEAIWVEVSVA